MEEPSPPPGEKARVDLWAWSVRLYKTRSAAAAACKKNQLLVNGRRCRAAKLVRVGDEIQIRQGLLTRIFEVRGILKRRVGAKEVPAYLSDLTPPEEYARVAALEKAARESTPRREPGTGRPTKRDRRELEEIGGAGTADVADVAEDPGFDEFVEAFLRNRPIR